MDTLWRIELFGGITARSGDKVITRFYSHKVACLLAYLALHISRSHSREELSFLFWPDAEPEAARLNLRVGLAALRRQLEPPSIPRGSVLIANRDSVTLNAQHISTDVGEFYAYVRSLDSERNPTELMRLLSAADGLIIGELAPQCYDDWIMSERNRIGDLHSAVLSRLISESEASGAITNAIDQAHRLLALDPMSEPAHHKLIDLLLRNDRPESAARQYRELERVMLETFGEKPSEQTTALMSCLGSMETAPGTRPKPRYQPLRKSSVQPDHPAQLSQPNRSILSLQAAPIVPNRFFGRERELDYFTGFISNVVGEEQNLPTDAHQRSRSIVTITGPGGVGKTRLAHEVAATVARHASVKLMLVSLSEVIEPDGIAEAILRACPTTRDSSQEAFDQAANCLSGRTLLVLDNFEQLLSTEDVAESSVRVITKLRERCPELFWIVTSRQALNTNYETELALQPLPTPLHPGTPERLLEFAGVQLFVDRAQSARADFQITPGNAADIAKVCRTLEGLPLALELAATMARILTPGQIVERLNSRFDALVTRRRDAVGRHRSLRAAIDWSYQLLSDELRNCFTSLSVFRGGFTVEAVRAMCDGLSPDTLLLSLCEWSMVVRHEGDGGAIRFSLLDSLREFAEEQITPEKQVYCRNRHGSYFARLAATAREHFGMADAAVWMDILEADIDNLRSALDWSLAQSDVTAGVTMAMDIDWFWFARGYISDRNRRINEIRSLLDRLDDLRPRAALWVAHFAETAEAESMFQSCLSMFQARGDEVGVADTLYMMGSAAAATGNYMEGERLFTESLDINVRVGSRMARSASRAALSFARKNLGDYSGSVRLLRELLEDHIASGSAEGAAKTQIGLANILIDQGFYAEADSHLMSVKAAYGAIGQKWGYADCLRNLGNLRCGIGLLSEGEQFLMESLERFKQIQDPVMVANLRLDLAEQFWRRVDDISCEKWLNECLAEAGTVKDTHVNIRLNQLRALHALDHSNTVCAMSYVTNAVNLLNTEFPNRMTVAIKHALSLVALQDKDQDKARQELDLALSCALIMGLRPEIIKLLILTANWCSQCGQLMVSHEIVSSAVSLAASLNLPLSSRDLAHASRIVDPMPLYNSHSSGMPSPTQLASASDMISDLVNSALKTLR